MAISRSSARRTLNIRRTRGTVRTTSDRKTGVTTMTQTITMTRRAMLALTLGAGAAALSGSLSARASSAPPVPPTQTVTAGTTPAASARRAPATGVGAGAVARQAATAGRSVHQLTVGGVSRRYVRHEPTGLDPATPAPLVLVLHGRGGNGAIAERMYDMNDLADTYDFVVAYPDALGDPPTWNADFLHQRAEPDDVGFIRALVEQEARTRPIDAARTFACGYSSGAMMTYALAAEASDLFPAVGIVAGTIGVQGRSGMASTVRTPPRPISVIHVHGTDDELVPYNGGSQRGPAGFVSVADSVRFWVAHNGCDPTPTTEQRGPSRRETYAGGQDGADVTLWTVQGGGHTWPKPTSPPAPAGTMAGISATDLIWAFFQAHPRAGSSPPAP